MLNIAQFLAKKWWVLSIMLTFWGRTIAVGLNAPKTDDAFKRVVGWLRQDNLGQLYLNALGWFMATLGDWIGDRHKLTQSYQDADRSKGFVYRIFGFNPFTSESYEKCLSLALIYPLLSFLVTWVMGATGQVGDISLFEHITTNGNNFQRWLIILAMILLMASSVWSIRHLKSYKQLIFLSLMFLVFSALAKWVGISTGFAKLYLFTWAVFLLAFLPIYIGGWLAGLLLFRSNKHSHRAIYAFAFIFAFAFSVAIGIIGGDTSPQVDSLNASGLLRNAHVLSSAFVIAISFALSVTFTFTFAFAVFVTYGVSLTVDSGLAIAYDFAISAAVASFATISIREIQKWSAAKFGAEGRFWLLYTLLVSVLSFAAVSVLTDKVYRFWILCLLLMPLVSAPLNWFSLGITRGLLQAVRSGKHTGIQALTWAILDLLWAVLFLLLITLMLLGVSEITNLMGTEDVVNVLEVLKGIGEGPAEPDNWWIYFMLLSTVLPTLIHFALAGAAATLWLPRNTRRWLVDGLEHDRHKNKLAMMYMLLTPIVGFILIPAGLLLSLWWLLRKAAELNIIDYLIAEISALVI